VACLTLPGGLADGIMAGLSSVLMDVGVPGFRHSE